MSSYIQRLISRGVESFSNAPSLSSVAKSQSPLVKNDQRLHDFDISRTVDIPVGLTSEGEDVSRNHFAEAPNKQSATIRPAVQNNTSPSTKEQSAPKLNNTSNELKDFRQEVRSKEAYNSSLMKRKQKTASHPLVETTKLIERKEIYQSPIIHEHITENHIVRDEQSDTINYVEIPKHSVHSFESDSHSSNQKASDYSEKNQEDKLSISDIVSKLTPPTPVNQQVLKEPSVYQDNHQPFPEQAEPQEIRATAPVNRIVQEYDSDNNSSPIKPTVIEKVIEKVVEKEVVNGPTQEVSNKQSKPATAESLSKIGSLPIRNSVFSIFGSRG